MNSRPLLPIITPTVGSCSIGVVSYSGNILGIAHCHISVLFLKAGRPNNETSSSRPPVPLTILPPEGAPAFLSSLRETNTIIVLVVRLPLVRHGTPRKGGLCRGPQPSPTSERLGAPRRSAPALGATAFMGSSSSQTADVLSLLAAGRTPASFSPRKTWGQLVGGCR